MREAAREIMERFGDRTGLTSERPPQRYLWTDAFAVANYLGLGQRELALRLVDQVHHVLGRHRPDDARSGWISGLAEAEGEAHPTRGGLRIGKRLPERPPGAPFDERLEWDRDGQYFHYLTRWMQALHLAGFVDWARELAEAAHRAFTYRSGARPRMFWKMSIDLSRPQVPSMGHHDPLEGLVTALQLQAPSLAQAVTDYTLMCEGRDWATADPLGLGGLLLDAFRLEALRAEPRLVEALLSAALRGLGDFARQGELALPADARLGFRELGLAIGLRAVERMESARVQREGLLRYAGLADDIVSYWLGHREASTWTGHLDINEVMLATALMPEGCLATPPG